MILFSLSIFISAFLLFQIQPMIGKLILPWFGGTPAVWSTAMLFFQVLLTGGYAYAYWLVKRPKQGWIHLAVLGGTIAILTTLGLVWSSPITPPANIHFAMTGLPVLDVFLILAASVGLPYFVLAANGPLMQAWYSRIFPERSYARLYALSNIGSLLGLLAYPLFVEPAFSVFYQGWGWAIVFFVFSVIVGILSWRTRNKPEFGGSALRTETPALALHVLWILLSGTASLFLLSVTNQVSQEVAVIPFLWILPLGVYLLSFVLAFSDSRWYERRIYALLFSLVSVAMLWVLTETESLNVLVQIIVYNLLLFLACMICHGELYRLRPQADHLTSFYLMVSLGGAAGGLFVNLAAPYLFSGYWEFYLGWLLVVVFLVALLWPGLHSRMERQAQIMVAAFVLGTVLLALGLNREDGPLFVERNFYGVIRVFDWDGEANSMVHGVTVHGLQFLDDRSRPRPTTYYVEDSGVGLLLLNHPRRGHGLRVGVLGLGAGTLAAYGETGDLYRFYEINPTVVQLAEGAGGYFSFLSDSRAEVVTVTGDARISLEQELAKGQRQDFDVLVLDTFSSDSIPVHLVTREAFALYLEHLAKDGVIAAHISNRHLDLRPILWLMAQEYDLSMIQIDRPASGGDNGFPSSWVLLARDSSLLEIPAIKSHSADFESYVTAIKPWTDDYSNLFQILK